MKKLLISLFAVILAASIFGCANNNGTDNTDNDETPVTYTVTISASTNGTVTANKTTGITAGETVTLTITPDDPDDADYTLETLSVKNGDAEVSVTNNTFTMPAANVTISATFTKTSYIGTKKPSRLKAVSDIVFNDGSAMPYTDYVVLEDEEKDAKKSSAIALIFYTGTGLNSGNDTTTIRTLGVGLKHSNTQKYDWASTSANARNTTTNAIFKNITSIICQPSGSAGSLSFSGDKNGSNNLEQIAHFLRAEGTEDDTSTDYIAFSFAKNYKNISGSNVKNTSFEKGWYLPSIAELYQIWQWRENGGKENSVYKIDTAISALGGNSFNITADIGARFWSSSLYEEYEGVVLKLFFGTGGCFGTNADQARVCCIREFNNSTSGVTCSTYRGVMASSSETVYIDFTFIDDSNWISQGYDSSYTSTKPQGTTFGTYSISGTTITINMPAFQTELTGTTSNNWTSIACTGFFSGTMTKQ